MDEQPQETEEPEQVVPEPKPQTEEQPQAGESEEAQPIYHNDRFLALGDIREYIIRIYEPVWA